MRYSATLITVLMALASMGVPVSGQTPPRPDRERMEAVQQRRAELEQNVRRQFLARAAERLALDNSQRARLQEVLDGGAEARRVLARESRQLRVELVRAVADDATSPTAYRQLLDRMQELRAREHALERREAAALAEFLDARQQAQLLVLRMQLTERVRGMRGQGPGNPPDDRPRDRRRRPGG